jgi:predicted RNA-binding Zn-ribbon protein involved in translation (DUF1610 family)
MLLSKNKCMKCNRGMMRLQQDVYSTYFACITCGATIVTRCPHCETPSIAIDFSQGHPIVYCRACECANAELAESECSYERVGFQVKKAAS